MKFVSILFRFIAIEAVIFGLFAAVTPTHASVGIISVDTSSAAVANDGDCSLPEAIAVINGTTIADCPSSGSASIDTIHFNLDPLTDPNYNATTGVFTITLTTALYTTHPLVLDGTSQPGYSASPLIWLNETGAGNHLLQLDAGSDGSTVKGLILSNTIAKVDLLITNGGNNTVQANYFDTDGTALQGNAAAGVDIGVNSGTSTNNLIGGPNAADRNLFANTGQYGVYLQSDGTNGNTIQGNYFGLQADGVTLISGQPTSGAAIILNPSGGAFSGNTIRGNTIVKFGDGIEIDAGTTQNTIAGNNIGVAADGSSAPGAPYSYSGIYLYGASSNTIGGVTAADRNVISNYGFGIEVYGTANNNVIEGNYIGTDATGSSAKGNLYGVWILGNLTDNPDSTTIGGTATGAGNVISGNTTDAVMIQSGPTDTRVLGNLIGTDRSGTTAIANDQGIRAIDATVMIGDSLTPGNNLISGNTWDGALIQNTAGSTVFGNKFGVSLDGALALPNKFGITVGSTSAQIGNNWIANSVHGVDVGTSATVVGPSSGNCFIGNTSDGVYNGNSGATAPFSGNWWGSSTGPTDAGNPGGTGDAVYGLVDYSSFLSAPPAACQVQLLANPGFEYDANHDKKPDSWTFANFQGATDKRDCTVRKSGTCSLKLTGNGTNKTATQTILRTGGAGEPFTFTLWSKASSVPAGGVYRLQVRFYNGTTLLATKTKNFSAGTHGFQSVSASYTAPGPYTKIVFKIIFKETSGTAWFDTAGLTWVP